MTADQHVFAAEAVCRGERDHDIEQIAEGFTDVILRVVLGTEGREQVVDDVADGVEDQVFSRAAGAAKGNAQFSEMALGVVLSEDFHLGAGVTGLLAKEGSARVSLAVVAQLRGGDRRPTGLLHCV